MLDADPATLYGVETRVLVQAVQAVKRNLERFPDDFMFQLTWEEAQPLRSQSVRLKRGANVKYRPYAFTEQGVAMVSSVLRSPQAVAVNIEVVRAFVRLREVLAGNKEMAAKLNELERKLKGHDQAITGIFDAVRQLMAPPPEPKKRPIGFITHEEKPGKPTVCPPFVCGVEAGSAVIATLDDVPRDAGKGETSAARHGGYFGENGNRSLAEKNRGPSPIVRK